MSFTPSSHDPSLSRPMSPLIWLVPDALLAEIEPEARPLVQRAFTERVKFAEAEREQPPERRRCAPPPFLFQHLARPRFQAGEPCQEDQAGLHRLLRRTTWLAVDALEAGVLVSAGDAYQPILAEQCAQLERIYREVKRRAGAALALVILQGELRFLRHRGAAAVEELLFA